MSRRAHLYLVQIGFESDCYLVFGPDEVLPRHAGVLVQTPRGIELGSVIDRVDPADVIGESNSVSLRIVRRVTRDDERLINRLQKYKIEAVRKCQEVLSASDSPAVLIDVDQLFDGNTLILHFLGPVDAVGRDLTDAIVREYENEVQSIRLSELMNVGCGPGCGTETGSGCGTSGGCVGCAIACKTDS